MKKVVSMILCAVLMLGVFAGCGAQKPEDVIKSEFKAISSLKDDEYTKVLGDSLGQSGLGTDNEEKLVEALLKNLSCETGKSTVNGDTATVSCKITNVNFGEAIQQGYQDALANAIANMGTLSEDELTQQTSDILVDALVNADTSNKITLDVNIELKKVSGKWEIQESDELTNAIVGDMINAMQELQ